MNNEYGVAIAALVYSIGFLLVVFYFVRGAEKGRR
ncbi:MAG: hypothetical protein G01um101416_1241 [Microgenomates group bacterium Gr01-1014_16]|nr:MAG: hypothetical protein G01um101416_1241 [Microgenomates group bacterium Gr01-1014_16]